MRSHLRPTPIWGLLVWAALAMLAPALANNRPLLAGAKGDWLAPVLLTDASLNQRLGLDPNQAQRDWRNYAWDWALWPPVRYTAQENDLANSQAVSPFGPQDLKQNQGWHYLGTDETGRDVLAGLLYGARLALLVGLGVTLLALLVGLMLGGAAGYWRDTGLRAPRGLLLVGLLLAPFAWFYGIHVRRYQLSESGNPARELFLSLVFVALIWVGPLWAAGKIHAWRRRSTRAKPLSEGWFWKPIALPLDALVLRLVELMLALPTLLLVIILAAFIGPSLGGLILLLALTAWPRMAQLVRAEMLRIRELPYIQAAQASGAPAWRILLVHALPNALGPLLVAASFAIAGAILAESALSFLGVGLAVEEVSWGSLLATSRRYPGAWWLAVFPGLAIFLTVLLFYSLGGWLQKRYDSPRPK